MPDLRPTRREILEITFCRFLMTMWSLVARASATRTFQSSSCLCLSCFVATAGYQNYDFCRFPTDSIYGIIMGTYRHDGFGSQRYVCYNAQKGTT